MTVQQSDAEQFVNDDKAALAEMLRILPPELLRTANFLKDLEYYLISADFEKQRNEFLEKHSQIFLDKPQLEPPSCYSVSEGEVSDRQGGSGETGPPGDPMVERQRIFHSYKMMVRKYLEYWKLDDTKIAELYQHTRYFIMQLRVLLNFEYRSGGNGAKQTVADLAIQASLSREFSHIADQILMALDFAKFELIVTGYAQSRDILKNYLAGEDKCEAEMWEMLEYTKTSPHLYWNYHKIQYRGGQAARDGGNNGASGSEEYMKARDEYAKAQNALRVFEDPVLNWARESSRDSYFKDITPEALKDAEESMCTDEEDDGNQNDGNNDGTTNSTNQKSPPLIRHLLHGGLHRKDDVWTTLLDEPDLNVTMHFDYSTGKTTLRSLVVLDLSAEQCINMIGNYSQERRNWDLMWSTHNIADDSIPARYCCQLSAMGRSQEIHNCKFVAGRNFNSPLTDFYKHEETGEEIVREVADHLKMLQSGFGPYYPFRNKKMNTDNRVNMPLGGKDGCFSHANPTPPRKQGESFVRMHTDLLPMFIKWCVGLPDVYHIRTGFRPSRHERGAYVYGIASWNGESDTHKPSIISKAGVLRPAGANRCVFVDLSESYSLKLIPNFLLARIGRLAMGHVKSMANKYRPWERTQMQMLGFKDDVFFADADESEGSEDAFQDCDNDNEPGEGGVLKKNSDDNLKNGTNTEDVQTSVSSKAMDEKELQDLMQLEAEAARILDEFS